MRVLVAIPLGSAYAPVLKSLTNVSRESCSLDLLFSLYGFEEDKKEALSAISNAREELNKHFNNVFIEEVDSTGFLHEAQAAANNLALKFARRNNYSAVLFIEPDVIAPPNILEGLLETNTPIAAGISNFKLVFENAGSEVNRLFTQIPTLNNETKLVPYSFLPFELKIGGFACLLLKQEALYEKGLNFDTGRGILSVEGLSGDLNFLLKAKYYGIQVEVNPNVICRREMDILKLTGEDLRRLRAISIASLYFKVMMIVMLRYYVRPKYVWLSKTLLSDNSPFKGLLNEWLKPSNRIFLIQSTPKEFIPIFGVNKILEAANEKQPIEATIFIPANVRGLSELAKIQLITASSQIYGSLGFIEAIEFINQFIRV